MLHLQFVNNVKNKWQKLMESSERLRHADENEHFRCWAVLSGDKSGLTVARWSAVMAEHSTDSSSLSSSTTDPELTNHLLWNMPLAGKIWLGLVEKKASSVPPNGWNQELSQMSRRVKIYFFQLKKTKKPWHDAYLWPYWIGFFRKK